MSGKAENRSQGEPGSVDERNRLFFEALSDPAYVIDQESGVLLDVNAAAARACGYTREEMVGLKITELSADPEATLATLADPVRANLPLLKRKDGTTFPVESSASTVEWGGRKVLLGVIRDVTGPRRTEQALHESDVLLATAFRNSPLLKSITDLATDRYLEVNETFCTLTGFTQDEMVGHTAVEIGLITPRERDLLAQQLMASQGKTPIELVIRSKSGKRIICTYWGTIVPTAAGPKLFAAAEDITAYREAQLAREEAFSRLEKIASRVPGVVYQYRLRPDGSSCFPFSSAGIREIYRVNPEDVREDASSVFSRIHPEDLDGVAASIQVSAKSLTPWRYDYRVKFDDGVVRWVHGDAVPEREADGSVLWHGYITDITERKQSEEALKTSKKRFELAMEATSDGLWDWDITTDNAYFSPGYYRMLGFETDNFGADAASWRDLIHPDDRVLASTTAVDCIEGRSDRIEIEYRLRSKSGDWRWILSRGQCVARDAKGRALRLLGTHVDITERKRVEEALKISERRFELAMEATSDGLWDFTGGGTYFSPGYYRMLGFEADSFGVTTATWRELVHPEDRAHVAKTIDDCLEGRTERFEFEYRMKSQNGDWRWMLGRGKCVGRDATGRALRLLGTNVDITERKRLQAGLAQNDRLASMGMLAAGVAHEINNPLAYVLANLDTLAQDLPRLATLTARLSTALRTQAGEAALSEVVADGRELLTTAALQDMVSSAEGALEGTRRIRKISRGLGTFARVERPELDTVDVNLAIETAATMAHNEVKYRARLVKDFGQVPLVLATDGKLAQVFLNLIINASHAIGEGNVERNRIGLRTWAAANSVFAEVSDTGHGIPPENLERIFEPFFTTKKVGLGSGLGLSISRNIITEFGGDIRVESQVGVGTRVIVRLPVNTKSQEKPVEAAVVKAASPGVHGRVLVVDDEEAIRKILMRVLGPQHAVVAVASGREAKVLLEKDPAFDVILCDLMMPEMTGMDLHAWLVKERPALARRCVFISGGAFTPTASDYLASVPNLRIDKPFDPTSLRAVVEELIAAKPVS